MVSANDTYKSFYESRSEILSVSDDIAKDKNEKPLTRNEALGTYDSLKSLESCIIAFFWNDILNRFNIVNKLLQSLSAELTTVVELYKSLDFYFWKAYFIGV